MKQVTALGLLLLALTACTHTNAPSEVRLETTSMSTACQALAETTTLPTYSRVWYTGAIDFQQELGMEAFPGGKGDFAAGETITVTATEPMEGALAFELGVTAWSESGEASDLAQLTEEVPGTLSYTFAADVQNVSVRFGAQSGSRLSAYATLDATCGAPTTPGEMLEGMLADIQELELDRSTATSFFKPLHNALKSLERGNIAAAISQIEAFTYHVGAQSGHHLEDHVATDLVSRAQAVIDAL